MPRVGCCRGPSWATPSRRLCATSSTAATHVQRSWWCPPSLRAWCSFETGSVVTTCSRKDAARATPLEERYPGTRRIARRALGDFPTPVRLMGELGRSVGHSDLYLKDDGVSAKAYG